MISLGTKTSDEILIEETKTIVVDGMSQDCESSCSTLAFKIDEYILKLGYSNAHVLSVTIQLLTRGKVRVDFRDYSERLTVMSDDGPMTSTQAASVFDEHITRNRSRNEEDASGSNMTQKIVVQAPRVQLPRR